MQHLCVAVMLTSAASSTDSLVTESFSNRSIILLPCQRTGILSFSHLRSKVSGHKRVAKLMLSTSNSSEL